MFDKVLDTFKNDHELKELFDLSMSMDNLEITQAKLKNHLKCHYID